MIEGMWVPSRHRFFTCSLFIPSSISASLRVLGAEESLDISLYNACKTTGLILYAAKFSKGVNVYGFYGFSFNCKFFPQIMA